MQAYSHVSADVSWQDRGYLQPPLQNLVVYQEFARVLIRTGDFVVDNNKLYLQVNNEIIY